MKWYAAIFAAVLLIAGCGSTYIRDDKKEDFAFEGKDWVSQATVDLENRGHTYKADVDKTWRAVHQVLNQMGVRVKDESRDWKVIHDTYYAAGPAREVQAFIKDINSRYSGFKVVKARYRLTISVNTVTRDRTNVITRVYWDVWKKGGSAWESWNPNRRVIEYFYRQLDKRIPAFRDDSEHMWKGW